ncbi:MAG TPA: MFS transporter [Vicinamibacterales bacterium]|nr:MFS transporter [Vicinamibacterales bacterium]
MSADRDTRGLPRAESRGQQIFAVVTAFLALFAIVGVALYGLPRFYPFFVQELGWTRQQVTSGNAYSKIAVAIIFGFLAGRLVDRFGPRRVMLAGIVMAGLALVGLSYVTTLSAFYFFYAFNALGYVCGGPLPNQVLLSRSFDKGRGKAMGIAYLGIGVGGALVPLLAYQLTQRFGWRGALWWLGILMIATALPAAWFVREPIAAAASARAAAAQSLAPILSRPAFFLLLVGSMASIGAVGGTMQNLALYLSLDRKLAQVDVDATLSLILIGSLVGRLFMGWLADRVAKKRVMILIYLIVAAAIPPLFYAPSPATLKLFAFVFGIGLGGDYMIIPLMAAELYGVAIMGRVMGIVLTADSVAESVVPMVVAGLRDRFGSYGPGFVVLVALAAIGAIAVSLLPGRPGADANAVGPPLAHRSAEREGGVTGRV